MHPLLIGNNRVRINVEDPEIGAILEVKPQKRRQVNLKALSNPVTIVQINSRARDDKSN